jgi:hypothetical protein
MEDVLDLGEFIGDLGLIGRDVGVGVGVKVRVGVVGLYYF